MKVNNTKNSAIQSANAKLLREAELARTRNQGKAQAHSQERLESSQVHMSKNALAMQKAKSIASQNTIDEAKVARLQKLIDEGKYKVDAEKVADRLVDEHLATSE